MMDKLVGNAKAFAKVNISLDIVSKMADGYHDMKMVMQSVSLFDDVRIECVPGCTRGAEISVVTNLTYLPGDERNIAYRAARLFFERTGITGMGARIELTKHIPVCAGLGGGSTDGACVLRLLNEMLDTRLGRRELEQLGGEIGSDVPFCVAGGTALATGRGENLTDITPLPRCGFVICKPSFAMSTPELFSRIQCSKIRARPDTTGIIECIESGDLGGVARRMYNVFEDVVPRGKRDIDDIKQRLLAAGALGAIMTGAGSAVFGLFDDMEKAAAACEDLKRDWRDCFVAETVERLALDG